MSRLWPRARRHGHLRVRHAARGPAAPRPMVLGHAGGVGRSPDGAARNAKAPRCAPSARSSGTRSSTNWPPPPPWRTWWRSCWRSYRGGGSVRTRRRRTSPSSWAGRVRPGETTPHEPARRAGLRLQGARLRNPVRLCAWPDRVPGLLLLLQPAEAPRAPGGRRRRPGQERWRGSANRGMPQRWPGAVRDTSTPGLFRRVSMSDSDDLGGPPRGCLLALALSCAFWALLLLCWAWWPR